MPDDDDAGRRSAVRVAIETLHAMWARSVTAEQAGWLEGELPRIGSPYDPARFAGAYAATGRRVRGPLSRVRQEDHRILAAVGVTDALAWPAPRVARVALLCAASDVLRPDAMVGLVAGLFRTGDNAEREALLGALSLLPEPRAYLTTALEACRTNVLSVFEAIACENPYPALYFPDDAFNRMILKSLFLGVSVLRIVDLERRANPELARMATDYAGERRAAGRPVPGEIALVESLCRVEEVKP